MCAIAGILGLRFDENIVDAMMDTMKRRGPDGNGVYIHNDCALLHSRLAIIDPEGGIQPMQCTVGSEKYVIVYNGELYNTHEIRTELLQCGHHFQNHSDTEVVLHAYIQWGSKALEKLNGIFAFAVWEEQQQRLFLARDRMGVKPLFYKLHDSGLLFSSEIKTILTYPTVRAQLDCEGVGEVLLLGPGRTPGSGVFRGIQELEPGCCGYYTGGKWTWWRYWTLKDREHRESFEETAEQVRSLVTDAILRQMVSDVPIGTFLSGGLDSSLISAICGSALRERGETLKTFSVDYLNNEQYFVSGKFQPNSDNQYIQCMQSFLKSDHYLSVLTPEMLIAKLENATLSRDLPGMADVDFSLLAFSRQIRGHVKVALSGECADEIFGGYPWYRDPEVLSVNGFPWAQNTSYRAQFLTPAYLEQLDADDFVQSRYRQTLSQCDILPEATPLERRMKQMVNLNMKWFMQTLLDRKDRMSMFSGLEVRVPFCDYRIAEYMYAVPWKYKDHGDCEKGLLRYAMKGILPEEVLYRKKSPYPKTHDPKYKTLVSALLREVIEDPHSPILQIVQKNKLETLLQAKTVWPWYGQLMQVPQTIAYMLQINDWLQKYHIQLV